MQECDLGRSSLMGSAYNIGGKMGREWVILAYLRSVLHFFHRIRTEHISLASLLFDEMKVAVVSRKFHSC